MTGLTLTPVSPGTGNTEGKRMPDVDVLAAAVRDLRARAAALRQDHPGGTDPLADALWEQCQQGDGHAFIYGDPRLVAAVALEHLAAEFAREGS